MSELELSKAEQRYFKPEEVVEYGLPQDCAKCPWLNSHVSRIALSQAYFGGTGNSGLMGDYLTRQRESEKLKLIETATNCPGVEELSVDEVESVRRRIGIDSSDTNTSIGYRCVATGLLAVATTYTGGITELSSLNDVNKLS